MACDNRLKYMAHDIEQAFDGLINSMKPVWLYRFLPLYHWTLSKIAGSSIRTSN